MIRRSDSTGSAGVALGVNVVPDACEMLPDGRSVEPNDPDSVEAVRSGVSEDSATTFSRGGVTDALVMEAATAGVIDRDTDAEFTEAADTPEESAELSETGLIGVV